MTDNPLSDPSSDLSPELPAPGTLDANALPMPGLPDLPPDGDIPPIAASTDPEARADMPRGARAAQFRQSQRLQISIAVPALALIALGVVYLFAPVWLTPALSIVGAVGVLSLSLLARFWLNARRERGLCFLGLVLLLWAGLLAAIIGRGLAIAQLWPVLIIALGLAALCTFLFERGHERGLILPGVALILAGGVALAALSPDAPPLGSLTALVTAYWPLLPIVLAVLLLPLAFIRRVQR